ncbi:DUF6512 family protein [Pseudothermotoga sp.]|uniref:DUF6512 family protein n=1 Tax=Pseudothermotoga sp. TaxID=2033661 RepID=UPI0031F6C513
MKTFLKILIYTVLFSILHFGYELTGWPLLKPFCGTDESVFEHLKMGFWAYLFASTIEFFILKKHGDFWPSRLFATTLVPWFILIVWYLVPALFGRIESLTIELIWAFAVVIISGIFGRVIEKELDQLNTSKNFRTIVSVLLIVSILFFVRFSFSKPWIDVFVDPHTL